MKNNIFSAFVLLVMLSLANVVYADDILPYFCGFETEEEAEDWTLKSLPDLKSEWCIDTAVARLGNKSLYVSADKGKTAGYDDTQTGYYIVAYRQMTLTEGALYDLVFDCRVDGEMGTKEAADAFRVVLAPVGDDKVKPRAGMFGQWPSYSGKYGFISNDNKKEFLDVPWQTVSGKIVAPEGFGNEYYLVFVWKTNGGDAAIGYGACIDNIQLDVDRDGSCADMPSNIERVGDGNVQGQTVTWSGNSDEYELHYFGKDIYGDYHNDTIVGITTTSYTFDYSKIPEGVYTVKVRAICEADTSLWNGYSNVLVYDRSKHCIDYINLTGSGVVATFGQYNTLYEDTAVVDKGYRSKFSKHTVHYDHEETDIRTGFGLKTVPDDVAASVRLSSWIEGASPSGSLSYEYDVTEEADVLKIRYAAVLQYQSGHPESGQTRIVVEIMDANTNTLLNECTRSDFNAKHVSNNTDKVRNWNKYVPPYYVVQDRTCPIMWCDWTTIGINLRDYVGMKLKIRLSLMACEANVHFAYAYFVMDCDKGEIQGVTCGEHPEVLRVPKGFLYRWYKTNDPNTVVGTTDSLVIAPNDTSHYSVDMIFPENDQCYFTLKASALPRKPISNMSYTVGTEECENRVKFTNLSEVFGFWEGDTIVTGDKCQMCEWDFGAYGKSTDFNPAIVVPAEGDTFTVKLRSSVDKSWNCVDEKEFTVEVPSLLPPILEIDYRICEGGVATHDTVTFDAPGDYAIEYKRASGCDSVVMVHVSMLVVENKAMKDTICSNETYDFFGKTFSEAGQYKDTVRNSDGCDSIITTLELAVNDALAVKWANDTTVVCADCGTAAVHYMHDGGFLTSISIRFDEAAIAAGLQNIDNGEVSGEVSDLKIEIPADIRPNRYNAEVTFVNADCGNMVLPLVLDVRYPSSIIVQRWNDVLALTNSEHNGGYTFSAYQWFKDGAPIDGEVSSILYRSTDMDYAASYSMLLTRQNDRVTQYTCGVTPVKYEAEVIDNVVSVTIVFDRREVTLESPAAASAYIYGIGGNLVSVHTLAQGENTFATPQVPGIYIMQIIYETDRIETHKIVVR